MALVAGGHTRKNETIFASLADGSAVAVKITSPVFYDPKGERQNV
jgi:sarcosine oxidase subunit alpha